MQYSQHFEPSRNHRTALAKICAPLFDNTEFCYFGYTRFFRDGTSSGLYTTPEAPQEVIEQGYGPPIANESGIFLPAGNYLAADIPTLVVNYFRSSDVESFYQRCSQIGEAIGEGSYVVTKYRDYDEIFFFGTRIPSIAARAYYLKTKHLMHHFCWYFLAEASEIIRESLHFALRLPCYEKVTSIQSGPELLEEAKFYSETAIKKFSFADLPNIHFSRQEFRLLHWLSRGLTFRASAEKMDISVRTAEHYWENIKIKSGFSSKDELSRLMENVSILWNPFQGR